LEWKQGDRRLFGKWPRTTRDYLERWQDDRRSFGKDAGRKEIIWKGGRKTGDHLERWQDDRRLFGKDKIIPVIYRMLKRIQGETEAVEM
jgi:hypothetical protein